MGAGAQLLIATVCVAALASLTLGQSQCKTITWGDTSGMPTTRHAPIHLQGGIRDWQLIIPKAVECYDQVAGLSFTGCDYAIAPKLKFQNKYLVKLHRIGDVEYPASARASVFCSDDYTVTKDQLSDQLGTTTWDASSWQKESDLGIKK